MSLLYLSWTWKNIQWHWPWPLLHILYNSHSHSHSYSQIAFTVAVAYTHYCEKCQGNEWFSNPVMYISWLIFEIFDLNKCTSIEFYTKSLCHHVYVFRWWARVRWKWWAGKWVLFGRNLVENDDDWNNNDNKGNNSKSNRHVDDEVWSQNITTIIIINTFGIWIIETIHNGCTLMYVQQLFMLYKENMCDEFIQYEMVACAYDNISSVWEEEKRR